MDALSVFVRDHAEDGHIVPKMSELQRYQEASMNVTVILVGTFRKGRFQEEVREYQPGTSVRDVIAELGLSSPLFGAALVNGLHAGVDDLLHEGDTLSLLPFVDGG